MAKIYTMGELLVEIMRTEKDKPLDEPALFMGPFPSGAPAIFISAAACGKMQCPEAVSARRLAMMVGRATAAPTALATKASGGISTGRVRYFPNSGTIPLAAPPTPISSSGLNLCALTTSSTL
jgi:hypothetical protein